MQILSDVMVCIEQLENGRISGKIMSPYEKNPVFFTNAADMLLMIDRIFDKVERESKTGEKLCQYHSFKEFSACRGRKGTFFFRILYRQYHTMQGTFFCSLFSRKPVIFRSTVELAYYIQDVVKLLEE